jgi:hypothetical protein
MEFTRKDVWATALVAAIVVAYFGYVAFGSLPFIEDVRGMAAVGLILGFASRRIGGREAFPRQRVAFVAGLASMGLGIIALATQSEVVLALFIASIVGLWVAAAYVRTRGHTGRVPVAH